MSAHAVALLAAASLQAPPPSFTVEIEAVYVDVFVTEANRPVTGLSEADFELWPAASPDKLRKAFLAILDAMKTRYVLRFEPDRVRREGLHQLEVRLTRRKGKVHCRKAYFVGPKTP